MTFEELFWSKVKKGPDCWEWQGGLVAGYGHISSRKHGYHRAHRLAWTLLRGAIPDGVCVLHHCDNRRCVNPAHLFLGSRKDNAIDMASKGRQHLQRAPWKMRGDLNPMRRHPELAPRGSKHGCAKLTEDRVLAIRRSRAAGATNKDLARLNGVSLSAISFITTGQTWKHVGGPITQRTA